MEYSAIVLNKHNNYKHDYIISVVPKETTDKGNEVLKTVNLTNNAHGETTEICYHIALIEYEHCIKRMERLDNKIYIMLTVCAFIFVAFSNTIVSLGKIKYPSNSINWFVVGIFLLGVVSCMYMLAQLIVRLIRALATIQISRFDSAEILNRSMVFLDSKKVVEYVIARYEKDAEINNELIDKKYKQVDHCVDLLANTVISLIVLMLFSNFVTQAGETDIKFMESILSNIDSMATNLCNYVSSWLSCAGRCSY